MTVVSPSQMGPDDFAGNAVSSPGSLILAGSSLGELSEWSALCSSASLLSPVFMLSVEGAVLTPTCSLSTVGCAATDPVEGIGGRIWELPLPCSWSTDPSAPAGGVSSEGSNDSERSAEALGDDAEELALSWAVVADATGG